MIHGVEFAVRVAVRIAGEHRRAERAVGRGDHRGESRADTRCDEVERLRERALGVLGGHQRADDVAEQCLLSDAVERFLIQPFVLQRHPELASDEHKQMELVIVPALRPLPQDGE